MTLQLTGFLKIYYCIIAGIIGATFGSFLNCLAWRITHGESVLKGRSHCPDCGHDLNASDLVPIFSWIFLKGKCRYCGQKISIRYPASELILTLLSVILFLKYSVSIEFLRLLILTFTLFTLTLTDLYDYIIPDSCVLTIAVNWLVFTIFSATGIKEVLYSLLVSFLFGAGVLAIVLLFDKITGKESMGGGDIKLLAVVSLYLGGLGSLFMLFIACIIGLVFAVTTNFRHSNDEKHFPFGPAIAISTWIMLVFGMPFIDWYLSLF